MLSDCTVSDEKTGYERLNPCSNGICSLTSLTSRYSQVMLLSLNPCSNGICSLTTLNLIPIRSSIGSLNPCSNGICSLTNTFAIVAHNFVGLNPCSNGICSLTEAKPVEQAAATES